MAKRGRPSKTKQPSSEFERKLSEEIDATASEPQAAAEKEPAAKPDGIPLKPSVELVIPLVKMPFEVWAVSQKIAALRLTDDEAALLGQPIIALWEYYLPQLPVIAWTWLAFIAMTYQVMVPRLRIIQKEQERRQTSSSSRAGGDKDSGGGGRKPPPPPPPEPTLETLQKQS
jgi:uncharacterized membrane protein YgcG